MKRTLSPNRTERFLLIGLFRARLRGCENNGTNLMEEAKHICVYSGSAHPELSQQIANYLGISLGKVHLTHFPDGEIFVQFEENVRRADAFLIQPTCKPPNDNLMELLIMIDAARRASAARITAVLPFFGYARQDRKDKPRVPITAKLVANLLTVAGADRIITMDLHAQQIQGFFDIPVDHLYARPVLVPYLKKLIGNNGVVVAPDSGSAKMAMNYGDMLEAGFAVVTKRRINATTVASSHLVGDVKDRICVITDDLTSTAGTLCAAAKILKANGAAKVYCAVSHCLLSDIGKEKLLATPEIEQVITTDAVPIVDDLGGKIKVVSIAPLLGEAIRRIHDGKSVSSLFYINH
ncbi:ribose-phosphate pyrophosphokinase [uncultured Victivallis sp.]|uniref:ribose-phosphate diphosphokinase n=1 Tax=uncultured Victivallis sp. TaxID=354118 RepID=UPI0025F461DE|nr:ribose-phosphate pyrophosphokinase [uncultured Victivallis sp.]